MEEIHKMNLKNDHKNGRRASLGSEVVKRGGGKEGSSLHSETVAQFTPPLLHEGQRKLNRE